MKCEGTYFDRDDESSKPCPRKAENLVTHKDGDTELYLCRYCVSPYRRKEQKGEGYRVVAISPDFRPAR